MDNANLSKLSFQSCNIEYPLKPAFNENLTSYQLTVPSNVDQVEISATTSDTCASYLIKSPQHVANKTCKLNDGLNKITIEVASEDGTLKRYEIECIKLSVRDAYLKALSIVDVDLTPEFDSNCFSYQAHVSAKCPSVRINVEKQDPNCQLSVANQTVLNLNYGHTRFDACCKSPDGTKSQVYTVLIKRQVPIRLVKFKNPNDALQHEDPVSLAPLYCSVNLNGSQGIYSQPFIEFFYLNFKQDFLTGNPVVGTDMTSWFDTNTDKDTAVSACAAYSPLINGDCTEPTAIRNFGVSIDDCSTLDKLPVNQFDETYEDAEPEIDSMHKSEIRKWEKDLAVIYDECDPKALMDECNKHLNAYLSLRNGHTKAKSYDTQNNPLDYLNRCIELCATAIKFDKKNHELHFKLATLLEEKHYLKEIYGFKNDTEDDVFRLGSASSASRANTIAKNSSKEEEINAVCKLKNIADNAPIELKIKALDDEYHYLTLNGQREKAEHIESLYLFKVRQSVMNTTISFDVTDSKMSLGQAYLKYMDALSMSDMSKTTKYLYHFHVGRMFCLRSNYQRAIRHLRFCLKWTNDEYKKPVRFYLAYAISLDQSALCDTNRSETAYFTCVGLQEFLMHMANSKVPQGLFATSLYSVFNVAFLQAFVNIANIGKTLMTNEFRVILPDDAFNYCAWLCCHALSEICSRVDSMRNLCKTSELVKQINWLLVRSHSHLLDSLSSQKPLNKKLIKKRCFYLSSLLRFVNKDNNVEVVNLQEAICQKLVRLSPCNSYFLYLLGNAKLEKYDSQYVLNKTDEFKELLFEAKSSLLASIELEEKMDNGPPLDSLTSQTWWKIADEKGKIQEGRQVEIKVEKVKPVEQPKKTSMQEAKSMVVSEKGTKPITKPKTTSEPNPKPQKPQKPVLTKQAPGVKSQISTNEAKKACNCNTPKDAVVQIPPPIEIPLVSIDPPQETETSSQEPNADGIKLNKKLPKSRLTLARVYARLDDTDNAKTYYAQMINFEPNSHEVYIEYADMLKRKGQHKDAVELYATFKYNAQSPSFDDAYVFGEIVNILMKNELYDDSRLAKYMVLWGRVLGIGILEKYIQKLDEKNKIQVCREVYCGVNGKKEDDPDLKGFFKYRGWVN